MNTMTPLQIKRAIEDAGHTQTMIAFECKVSRPTVCQVIKKIRASHKVRCRIAEVIGKPVEEVFDIKPNPTKTGPEPSVTKSNIKHC